MPVISIRDLVKTYHVGEVTVRALRGANVDVEAGEFVAVTGPSGSGKSTLMHILGCLDRPTSGSYVLDGKDVSRMSKDNLAIVRNRKIGFVFRGSTSCRGPRRSTTSSCRCSTTAPRSSRRPSVTSGRWRPWRPSDWASVSITIPNQLSGGQQQRVAIARALVTRPTMLLADEPTGNLDTRTSIEVMGIFQKLNVERGITVLLITHEMDIAEYGTRLVRFRDGRIQSDQAIRNRRDAATELALLPQQEEESASSCRRAVLWSLKLPLPDEDRCKTAGSG